MKVDVTPIEAVRAALAAHDAEERDELGITMHSQLYEHGATTEKVTVLLHGLTASPPAFDELAQELHRLGHTVIVPRIVRHGYADRMTKTLAALSAEELRNFGERIIGIAALLGGEITVLGHSLGGTLALWIAQRHPIARAVAVAPFLGVTFLPHELHRAVLPIVRRLPNRFLFWDPIARENLMPAHGYPRYSTHALCAALEVADELRSDAAHEAPRAAAIDIVLNASETSVNNRTAQLLSQRWKREGSERVRVHRLRGLPPSHDVIEPYRGFGSRVYPTLVGLANGARLEDG